MNRRVLLVDDQADFLEGIRRLLGSSCDVTTAQSGAQACAICEEHGPFALVISDFGMPGMTGIELFAELRERWPETVRIMVTGCAELGLALEALEQGAIFRFLTKPPAPSRLLEAVNAGLARFREAEEARLLTEQLVFVQESLRSFQDRLEEELGDVVSRIVALERHAVAMERAGSLEEVLARTSETVRGFLGTRVASVELRDPGCGVEVVPRGTLSAAELRTLSVLTSSSRLAVETLRRRADGARSERTTLRALENMARYRDDETAEHLARVSNLSRLLARSLGKLPRYAAIIDERFVEHIGLAAPLHDLGKVAIPDAILFKPGKLDEREWEIMRTHAAIGADILRGAAATGAYSEHAGALALAAEIAGTHHERWDGTGYPRGLAGEDIPLSGRIVSLADCYDALTSERPYKHAWSHAEALVYVREQRGQAFDPELVDRFLAHEPEVEALLLATQASAR